MDCQEMKYYDYIYYYTILSTIISFIILFIFRENDFIKKITLVVGLWMGFTIIYPIYYQLIKHIMKREYKKLNNDHINNTDE